MKSQPRRTQVILACLLIAFSLAIASDTGAASEKKGKKGWLGVSIQDMSAKIARTMKGDIKEGVLITKVHDGSPAEKAGLKEEDIIVEFGGKKVATAGDLQKAVSAVKPETKSSLVAYRDGEKKTFNVVVGEQKEDQFVSLMSPGKSYSWSGDAAAPFMAFASHGATLGLRVSELNEQLAEYFEVPSGEGVLVEFVNKNSPAEKAGFKAGDVLVKIGKKLIDEISDIHKVLGKLDDGDTIMVDVLRKGMQKSLTVIVEKDSDVEWNMSAPPAGFPFHGAMPGGRIHVQKFGDSGEEELEIDGAPHVRTFKLHADDDSEEKEIIIAPKVDVDEETDDDEPGVVRKKIRITVPDVPSEKQLKKTIELRMKGLDRNINADVERHMKKLRYTIESQVRSQSI